MLPSIQIQIYFDTGRSKIYIMLVLVHFQIYFDTGRLKIFIMLVSVNNTNTFLCIKVKDTQIFTITNWHWAQNIDNHF